MIHTCSILMFGSILATPSNTHTKPTHISCKMISNDNMILIIQNHVLSIKLGSQTHFIVESDWHFLEHGSRGMGYQLVLETRIFPSHHQNYHLQTRFRRRFGKPKKGCATQQNMSQLQNIWAHLVELYMVVSLVGVVAISLYSDAFVIFLENLS